MMMVMTSAMVAVSAMISMSSIFCENRIPERLYKKLDNCVHCGDYNQKSEIYQPYQNKYSLEKNRSQSEGYEPTHQKWKQKYTYKKYYFS